MRKKGAVELTLSESWGLIKSFAIILIILVVSTKIFFFVNPAYAASKSTLERFSEVIKLLEDGESRSVTLDIEKGVWLFGFNKDQNFIEYRRTVRLIQRQTLTLSKPMDCPTGRACLCLCTDECKRVIDCKDFDDIKFFVVTDISQDLNGGVSYEYDGKQGNYLAMPGKGVIRIEISREKEVIYIGTFVSEKEEARAEFERFVSFAKNNINTRYRGTCKLDFGFDTQKLTDQYYIIVYADGNVRLFSGRRGQEKNIAEDSVGIAPILNEELDLDAANEAFNNYGNLQTKSFVIDPHTTTLPEGVEEGIFDRVVVLLQRDGRWLWTKSSDKSYQINNCEKEFIH